MFWRRRYTRGCGSCGTGIEMVLHVMSPGEAKRWATGTAEPFPMDDENYGCLRIPIIHPEQLVEAAKSVDFEEMVGEIDLSEYDSLAALLQDVGYPLLMVALDLTRAKAKEVQTT